VDVKILLVDDDPDSVKPLMDEIRRELKSATCKLVGFPAAIDEMESYDPHVVILDIMQGRIAAGDPVGLKTREYVWQTAFCPLVIYTAMVEQVQQDADSRHPFVKVVQKGSGSEQEVIACIQGFEVHIAALNEVANEIRRVMYRALQDVAPRIFDTEKESTKISDALTRAARRRVAAAMDEALTKGTPNLKSWEHYLCPPPSSHLLTGDIIRKIHGEDSDPSSYAVVLTPSCDLARQAKVTAVLVARCTYVQRLLKDLNLEECKNPTKVKDRVEPVLAQGQSHSCLPLPALPGVFPPMVADFRSLALVQLDGMTDGKDKYEPVASVDSPFRELVAWAYVSNAARPGLPERDVESWAGEIVGALKLPEKSGGK
jgi:CheY-like chemotaxis protein